MLGVVTVLLPFFAAGGAFAQSDRYAQCLERAQRDPAGAREAAAQWEALGGGAPARHCAAIALIGVGAEGRAALLLTEIGSEAAELPIPDRLAALTLAGELWLRLERPDLAQRVFAAGLELAPGEREAQIGLGQAAAGLGDWAAATAALTPAITAAERSGGVDPEALTLRAAALREGGDPQAALIDATAATNAAPTAALAWFERGAAERALDRLDAARESWLQASILDPDGAAGDLARHNLQVLADR